MITIQTCLIIKSPHVPSGEQSSDCVGVLGQGRVAGGGLLHRAQEESPPLVIISTRRSYIEATAASVAMRRRSASMNASGVTKGMLAQYINRGNAWHENLDHHTNLEGLGRYKRR